VKEVDGRGEEAKGQNDADGGGKGFLPGESAIRNKHGNQDHTTASAEKTIHKAGGTPHKQCPRAATSF